MDPHDLDRFRVPGSVDFADGPGGRPLAVLTHPSGARAEITLHGAQVTRWRDARGIDRLYLSPRADFADDRAIRGGIPVIFPQFGDGPLPRAAETPASRPLPKHGFARTRPWRVLHAGRGTDGAPAITLLLTEDDTTLRLWPHRFRVELTVRLADTLELVFRVANPGPVPFVFQAALHTYFLVADARRAEVRGLAGTLYEDFLRDHARDVETRVAFPAEGEIDRLYVQAPRPLSVWDGEVGASVSIDAVEFHDAVVWNPGPDKARALADLGPGEERHFVCVESGEIDQPVELTPAAEWQAVVVLQPL